MEKFKIFFIEDDPWYGEILACPLSLNPNYGMERLVSDGDYLQDLSSRPGLIIFDYSLPGLDGPDLLRNVRASHPKLPVIVISDQEDAAAAVELLKEGASDYFVKNEFTAELLWNAVARIHKLQSLEHELAQLRETLENTAAGGPFGAGQERPLRAYMVQIIQSFLRKYDHNVVRVAGKLGIGKSTIYKMIQTGEVVIE